jgi:prepilin-type processing-associated H-X9-DG protein
VWDCPTTSFKGTEAAPDYFYVGGSFLAGTALGDVKDPTAAPLLADLRDGKGNKPYVMDNGNTNLTQAANQLDTRHNNGAVFAYVDGHLGWLSAAAAQPYIFLPSAIGLNANVPTCLGNLFTTPLRLDQHRYSVNGDAPGTPNSWTNPWGGDYQTISNACNSNGITIAMGTGWTNNTTVMFYMGDSMNNWTLSASGWGAVPAALTNNYTRTGAPQARPPSWWKYDGTANGTQATGGLGGPAGCWWGNNTYENGCEVQSLCPTGGTYRLLIVPNVTAPTVKKMLLYICNSSRVTCIGTNGKVHLNYVKIGTTNYADTSFTVTPEASAGADRGGCNGVLITLPVLPGKNIDISYSVTAGTNVGSSMMFED